MREICLSDRWPNVRFQGGARLHRAHARRSFSAAGRRNL